MANTTSPEEIKKTVKTHITIGVVLLVTTALTVAQSFFPYENASLKIIVGLTISVINAALVSVIFMHLGTDWKHRSIKYSMGLAAVFFVALMLLTLLGKLDYIKAHF